MNKQRRRSKQRLIETHSSQNPPWVAIPNISNLYKRIGNREVSFYYRHSDRRLETLAKAQAGDRIAIREAQTKAIRLAMDYKAGAVVVGSMGEAITRFRNEIAPTHYADQSKEGIAIRNSMFRNLIAYFGKMSPRQVKKIHGYHYLEDRAASGAPVKANKELAQLSTVCYWLERKGVIDANPFVGMKFNVADRKVRITTRRQIVQFYLWSIKQENQSYRIMGCAAMFTYLTGFRPSEVRPLSIKTLVKDGVSIESSKRKKGEDTIYKIREWSPRLRTVVARAQQRDKPSNFIFGSIRGKQNPYTRTGWNSVWRDAMASWLGTEGDAPTTAHPDYFSLQDIRPAAITTKLRKRDGDAYDFAAHSSPNTTHTYYDRRVEKRAKPTE